MPRDFAKLVACKAIPIEWRRLYAVAVFTFLRPEELYGLTWLDVDWDAHEIRVRRALDIRTGKEKNQGKTRSAIREVPIHPNLMPLLEAMAKGQPKTAAVVPIATRTRDVEKNAATLRVHAELAGIDPLILC